jgi:hypothetical protein
MNKTISEDMLRGIAEALQLHAPHLLPTFYKIMRGGQVIHPEAKRGSSIFSKLAATVPWEDGEPILRALETIEREHGFQALFAKRQINLLLNAWRQFVEPGQLPPQL